MKKRESFKTRFLKFLGRMAWHFGIPPEMIEGDNKKKSKKTNNTVSKTSNNRNENQDKENKNSRTKGQSSKSSENKELKNSKNKGQLDKSSKSKDSKKQDSKDNIENDEEVEEEVEEKVEEKKHVVPVFGKSEIEELLNNDNSLKDIATVKELQSLDTNHMNVPTLLPEHLLKFDKNIFEVDNFMGLYLYMIVNKKQDYLLEYKNCNCTDEQLDILYNLLYKAFDKVKPFYIEYFSGLDICFKHSLKMDNMTGFIQDIKIQILFKESYPNSFEDTFKMLKLCRYVKTELVNKGKIKKEMSQYDIAKVLYNWTVLHTDYDKDKSDDGHKFSGYYAVAKGKAVCQGYTAMYNALCRCCEIGVYGMLGICADRETGGYEHHIWTLANINNKKMFIDSTWGRPVLQNKKELEKKGIKTDLFCDFKWLNTPYKEFIKEHSWDKKIYPF